MVRSQMHSSARAAGDPNACFNNAVFGGIDNFSTDAHLLHAFVVLNGNCAQTPTQLPDLKYRLVRVLGRVLGLDASQTNPNGIHASSRAHIGGLRRLGAHAFSRHS